MLYKRLTILCSLILTILVAACSHYSGVTKEEMDVLIAKEVASGASKSQVITFLDAHHIEHSSVEVFPPDYLKNPELDTDLSSDKLKGKVGRVRKVIAAKIPNVKSDFPSTFDIFIRFYLDKDDRMVEYTVRTIGTGL